MHVMPDASDAEHTNAYSRVRMMLDNIHTSSLRTWNGI